MPGDDEHTLHERIKPVERRLLIDVVRDIADGVIDLDRVPRGIPTLTPRRGIVRPYRPPAKEQPMAGPRHDPTLYRDRDVVPIRRALVSVSDKTALLELAAALAAADVEIVSTGLDRRDRSATPGTPSPTSRASRASPSRSTAA